MIAHIRETDGKTQSVREHCRATAALCGSYAGLIGAGHIGQLAGLLHDAGKLSGAFQAYIRQESKASRGEIDHSFAGARYLCELADREDAVRYRDVSRLIARIILSHHGLHDLLAHGDVDYLAYRIGKTEHYDEVCEALHEIAADDELVALLGLADQEYRTIIASIKALARDERVEKAHQCHCYAFYLGMLERFLQSCLIDADRTDTASFMSAEATEKVFDLPSVWEQMAERMQEKCTSFAKRTDPISVQRCSISDRCAAFAAHPVKACRLIVPTGGGKTLSSLRFAIDHCRRHGKRKIVYTAPFMSILEQNSDEIRAIAGDDAFTEHWSDLLADIETKEALHEYELRTEKWDAPVIATTMVQLLETLFSARTSAVRRMHRLADAVIIIDEVQSIPLRCVHLFDLAVDMLTHICGTTVVLCTATQPAVEQTAFPLLLDAESSMTGDTTADFAALRRTELISAVTPHGSTYEEAAAFCEERFIENGDLLLIVNTKAAARELFRLMKARCPQAHVIHLSTDLCPAHRREKIREMRCLLDAQTPLICVTTQLIEAGVDISFRCVVRSLAGLDNAAQAAGRCNRNGESAAPCPVYLIKLKEEGVQYLDGMSRAQSITAQIMGNEGYTDYLSEETQHAYFQELYRSVADILSYPVIEPDTSYKTDLVELLSCNSDHFEMSKLPKHRRFSVQAFKTAGTLFKVIDSHTQEVIVPWGQEAEALIDALSRDQTPERYRELLRKAQRYSVSVYDVRKLDAVGAVRTLACGAMVRDPRFYDADCGITTEGAPQETLIF